MGGHGTTKTNPFPKATIDPNLKWQEAWPELDYANTDPIVEAADFYILQGLSESAFVQFDRLTLPQPAKVLQAAITLGVSLDEYEQRNVIAKEVYINDPRQKLTELADEAKLMLVAQVNKLDPVFVSYLHLACGGELRHHGAVGGKTYSSNRHEAWAGWKAVFDTYGLDSLKTMASLFREFVGGSFGGEKWAVAADLLYDRLQGKLGPDTWSNKMLFIDRVFTLEHNGGCFLNKLAAYWLNLYTKPITFLQSTILAAHCENPPNVKLLYEFTSPDVKAMFDRYMEVVNHYNMEFVGVWDDKPVASSVPSKLPHITVTTKPQTFKILYDEAVHGDPFEAEEAFIDITQGIHIHLPGSGYVPFNFNNNPNNVVFKHSEYLVEFSFSFGNGKPFTKQYLLNAEEIKGKNFYWKHMNKTSPTVPYTMIIGVYGDSNLLGRISFGQDEMVHYTKITGPALVRAFE